MPASTFFEPGLGAVLSISGLLIVVKLISLLIEPDNLSEFEGNIQEPSFSS
jgi:hypothetical protein